MAMRSNDDKRCNCEKIFSKETLNCCCDKTKRDCKCELTDYKCCMKITPGTCCDEGSDTSDKKCTCGKEEVKDEEALNEDESSETESTESEDEDRKRHTCYKVRRFKDEDKCCCEINGKLECCCSDIKNKSCCCIIAGNDECCCEHLKTNYLSDQSTPVKNQSRERIVQTQVIERTTVKGGISANSSISMSNGNIKNPTEHFSTTNKDNASTCNDRTCSCCRTQESSSVNLSDMTEEIPSDLENPSILTSTCLASTKRKEDFKKVDEELISELKEFKKTSLSQESYDVYIVNDEGRVNSFELKHYLNRSKNQDLSDSNPKEEFLNKQIHGICIKNKQSEMNSTYHGKMRTILDKIKNQSRLETNKENEPTILEITEFSLCDKDKTKELIKNVFGSERSSCRCNGKSSCLCECNMSKVEIIEGSSTDRSRTKTPQTIDLTDLKSFSADVDALNNEINKASNGTNTTINPILQANESDIYEHQLSSNEDSNSKEKLYYSINSSSESDLVGSVEDVVVETRQTLCEEDAQNVDQEEERGVFSIKSPFENDMRNKIEDAITAQNVRQDGAIERININVGGRIIQPDENGLEVTSFRMNIHEDEDIGENESPSDELIDKLMRNNGAPKEDDKVAEDGHEEEVKVSIHESSRIALEKIQEIEEKVAEQVEEENVGFFGLKIGSVIKNMFEGNSAEDKTTSSSFAESSKDETNKEEDKEIQPNERETSSAPILPTIPKTKSAESVKPSTPSETQSESLSSRTFISNEELNNQSNPSNINVNVYSIPQPADISNLSNGSSSRSTVSCLAKARTEGNTIEIALHLTNTGEEPNTQSENGDSTITFVEQDNSENSSSLALCKRNNKVGKLIEYFEELEKRK